MQTSLTHTQLLIDGRWTDGASGRRRDVVNPATGAVVGTVAYADEQDLAQLADAAASGFRMWRHTTAIERANLMRKAAVLLRERVEIIARLMTLEQGKPLAEARVEVMSGADTIEWFADEGLRTYGRVVAPRNLSVQQLVLKEPVGPVAAFTPWNFPINQAVRKISAALATGCSIVVKAPEETPASPAELLRSFVDAGVPAGVVGLAYGEPSEISNYLIRHPAIRKVTFTGSTPVGKQLASLAGQHMKRVTMELGGHAPVIVCEDADIGNAIRATAAAKFRNAGQVCIAPTRFLVHNSIRNEFTQAFVEHTKGISVGDGLAVDTQMGPLANERRLTAMAHFTKDALARGATLELGGRRIGEVGNFYAPTVLGNVSLDAEVFSNEPFGPVAAIRGFDDLDEAIAEANRLPYGLASFGYTRSIRNAHRLGNELEVGMLWINQPALAVPEMPFGGVKDSGYGSEGGPEAMESYLVSKSVSIMSL
ncbi:NAD-dependent succinate-semialdehyde dehydrogenase [Variovorax sp. 770b2]|uniref:NAD-dependent succinate-semialdehyde dehydrogenase n=1 Tax=Variovorax sp. 770b2 TaxID=1566271 RepID=UPI0008DF6114|nr:NAD-dependent succinate-semialdehyde dehydrogenase [Variovorax sp. 770b2]SFQ05087.1 succinate-semialdehyde dehydrogenase / glutarate-semialdehyde dehydrogenase [Variovorax sp. 770b2]